MLSSTFLWLLLWLSPFLVANIGSDKITFAGHFADWKPLGFLVVVCVALIFVLARQGVLASRNALYISLSLTFVITNYAIFNIGSMPLVLLLIPGMVLLFITLPPRFSLIAAFSG
jgi:hypothetical protein